MNVTSVIRKPDAAQFWERFSDTMTNTLTLGHENPCTPFVGNGYHFKTENIMRCISPSKSSHETGIKIHEVNITILVLKVCFCFKCYAIKSINFFLTKYK